METAPFFRVDGWITGVQGGPLGIANTITYSAQGIGPDGVVEVENATPYNRSYNRAELYAAAVNDLVVMQVNRATGDVKLYVWTERDALRNCQGELIEDL